MYNKILIFTWKPHFKHTTMSLDVLISVSITVLSFRQSEQTSHTLDSTDFFTDVRSTALPTCWQVKPDCKIEFKVTIISLFVNWCIKVVRLPTKRIKCSIYEKKIKGWLKKVSILNNSTRLTPLLGAKFNLPLTSSDDSSSRGFLGLLVRLVISAAFKEKGSFRRIWSSGWNTSQSSYM